MASRRSPACTGPPIGAVVPVPPVGGAVVPHGEAVVPVPALDPESLPLVSWNAITASAAASATHECDHEHRRTTARRPRRHRTAAPGITRRGGGRLLGAGLAGTGTTSGDPP